MRKIISGSVCRFIGTASFHERMLDAISKGGLVLSTSAVEFVETKSALKADEINKLPPTAEVTVHEGGLVGVTPVADGVSSESTTGDADAPERGSGDDQDEQ